MGNLGTVEGFLHEFKILQKTWVLWSKLHSM